MDYWNGLSFFSPAKELTIYIEELSLAHAGLACNVVLARAFPRDFTPALDFIIEHFHRGRGLFLLLAVATGFYMLKVPNWESLSPQY